MIPQLSIAAADDDAKAAIFSLRHDIYADELHQYESTLDRTLPDAPEVQSVYLALWAEPELIGFVGITPPNSPRFSIEKQLRREEQSFLFDDSLYEIRALTVARAWRSFRIAGCLMYAAYRWVAAHGGSRIVSMGRKEVIDLYIRFGFQRVGQCYICGEVEFELLVAQLTDMEKNLERYQSQLERMKRTLSWQLEFEFSTPRLSAGGTDELAGHGDVRFGTEFADNNSSD